MRADAEALAVGERSLGVSVPSQRGAGRAAAGATEVDGLIEAMEKGSGAAHMHTINGLS